MLRSEIKNLTFDRIESLTNNFSFTVGGCRRKYAKSNALCSQQHPKELFSMMTYLKDKNIRSYMEIGLGNCTTVFILDSFFRSLSKHYLETVGLCIRDCSNCFTEYDEPTCRFVMANVVDYDFSLFANQFDFIFIDTNQERASLEITFEKCKNARYVAFHDVSSKRYHYGARSLFKDLETKYESQKWSHSLAGIGLLKIRG